MTLRCDHCGKFYSERTANKHRTCAMILAEEESGYHPIYGVVQGALRK